MKARPFLVDSDVFITSKNPYYAFDICPGFWNSLVHHYHAGGVRSIDRVRVELLAGRKTEDLVKWVKSELAREFFLDTSGEDIVSAYEEVMLWVQRNPQYLDPAKAKFATEADGWLVAYAMADGGMVITNEQSRPESKSRILLPDVCDNFNIEYRDAFHMLRKLNIRFEWRPSG